MSDEMLKARGNNLGTIFISAAIGIAVTLALLILFAAIIYFLGLDRAYSAPFGTLSLSIGSFAAAYFVSRKIGRRGYLTGALVGLITFGAVTVISMIISKNGLTANTLFHFIIIVLASAIGGILGVNRGKNKKYI